MRNFRIIITAVASLAACATVAMAGGTHDNVDFLDHVEMDPSNFDNPTQIDNTWLPLKPGTHRVFEGFTMDDGERLPHRIEYTVTDLTKVIQGVRTVVVWIEDIAEGETVEKEIAFYAQANNGDVWFFGEYPEAYEDGQLVEAPTWIAGIQDAKAGIAMQANPRLETTSYSQGWGPAVDWTDRAQVFQMGQKTCVRVDCYENVLIMDEFSRGEPGYQLKYYAPGVGNVRVGWRGPEEQSEELELVELRMLDATEMAAVRGKALRLEQNAFRLSKDVYAHTQPTERLLPRHGEE